MGMLVGRGSSRLYCDTTECRIESDSVHGENDGQRDVRPTMQRRGWQCTTNGKDYCPEHAYRGGSLSNKELSTRSVQP